MDNRTTARRATLISNCVNADWRDHRESYKTRGGYVRSAVKRLAFYEITATDIEAAIAW